MHYTCLICMQTHVQMLTKQSRYTSRILQLNVLDSHSHSSACEFASTLGAPYHTVSRPGNEASIPQGPKVTYTPDAMVSLRTRLFALRTIWPSCIDILFWLHQNGVGNKRLFRVARLNYGEARKEPQPSLAPSHNCKGRWPPHVGYVTALPRL